jgi:aryl carrier-like protein
MMALSVVALRASRRTAMPSAPWRSEADCPRIPGGALSNDGRAVGATVTDERLRRATLEGILAVLHPSLMEQLRSAVMIDINQLPKNPALERWKAALRAEGAVEGEVRGEARMLVRILRGRGFVVGAEVEARVLATDSVDALERWADRALTAASLEDVFA